jgi:hypothetical protein
MINMQQEHKLPNNRYQYSENPHAVHDAHSHDRTVSTRCAVTAQKITESAVVLKKYILASHYVKLISTPVLQEIRRDYRKNC